VNVDLSKLLELDPVDGILRAGLGAEGIDREVMETIRLQLEVQDIASETGLQIAHAVLVVTINDENDNDPKFRVDPYVGTVAENTEPGIVVMTVTAEDADKDRSIRYSLVPGREDKDRDTAKFPLTIDPETGVVELAYKIDRETRDWINFTVVAQDSGSMPKKRHATANVMLRIIDKNDNVVREISWNTLFF